jgi:hypothetical protein
MDVLMGGEICGAVAHALSPAPAASKDIAMRERMNVRSLEGLRTLRSRALKAL